MENTAYYEDEVFEQDENDKRRQDNHKRQQIRRQAYNRTTDYVHPRVNFFDHEPINSKESEQLRKELIGLYKPKVDFARKQYDKEELTKNYDKYYEQFIKMTLKNQIQQRQMTQSIDQMHQMADILLNKQDLNAGGIFLYSKMQPSQEEQQQIDHLFNRFQEWYKDGEPIEDNNAEDTIKRAKHFLRDRYT